MGCRESQSSCHAGYGSDISSSSKNPRHKSVVSRATDDSHIGCHTGYGLRLWSEISRLSHGLQGVTDRLPHGLWSEISRLSHGLQGVTDRLPRRFSAVVGYKPMSDTVGGRQW
ncbi:hypothetical protein J6590_057403 [Homalodisca vitripennis]|nr:hypothetical protein J6590_057403 [Homalodisca vitripennis]